MPSPGLIRGLRPASGPGVRDDGGVSVGYTVPVFYDSMIAKLVAWGGSRREAIERMARALREYQVLGIRTTIPFFLWLMRQPDYVAGRYDTTYLDRLLAERSGESFSELTAADEELARSRPRSTRILRANRATLPMPGRRVGRDRTGSGPRGARRCADDVRDRGQRPRPHGLDRAGGAGRYRVIVDGRRARRRRGARRQLRALAVARRRRRSSREVQVAPGGAPARCWCARRPTVRQPSIDGRRRRGRRRRDGGARARRAGRRRADAGPRRPCARRAGRRGRRPASRSWSSKR